MYNVNGYVFNKVYIELHKMYMKKHVSLHDIYSYLLLPVPKQVLFLINIDSLSFDSNEIRRQIVLFGTKNM